MESIRVRIDLGYDGTHFSGWAEQPGRRTVQGELSTALATVLRAAAPVRLTVAGRTDAGVHARGQVAHVDVDPEAWQRVPGRSGRMPAIAAVHRLNGVLPADVVVHTVTEAPDGFDARFSALSRRYRYRIVDDVRSWDPLRRGDTVFLPGALDAEAMGEAARSLVGLHDFAAFCRKREGATTVRNLLDYCWRRDDDGVLVATVSADAFCQSMVRALVGAVVPVGSGLQPAAFVAEVLAARRRDPRVRVMPPHGLSLEEVVYPCEAELAARATQTRAVRSLPETSA